MGILEHQINIQIFNCLTLGYNLSYELEIFIEKISTFKTHFSKKVLLKNIVAKEVPVLQAFGLTLKKTSAHMTEEFSCLLRNHAVSFK